MQNEENLRDEEAYHVNGLPYMIEHQRIRELRRALLPVEYLNFLRGIKGSESIITRQVMLLAELARLLQMRLIQAQSSSVDTDERSDLPVDLVSPGELSDAGSRPAKPVVPPHPLQTP